ncbi:hypothetical protein TVNIR_0960 [Thioalkalivibrio nitratireducens DSM 14787]|uniref:Uncharacterized protein n=1 Tax=Thioalkalivibrio nitratireducens (strain DSM 14787 / UNIQEM 213 / ALEN2) TaxID=1255043 RepID=L0DWA8_THIND|nr:hypothetical protein TVNIR_0960 [Thioalkalivibrio nitratireducens DSM 14787]
MWAGLGPEDVHPRPGFRGIGRCRRGESQQREQGGQQHEHAFHTAHRHLLGGCLPHSDDRRPSVPAASIGWRQNRDHDLGQPKAVGGQRRSLVVRCAYRNPRFRPFDARRRRMHPMSGRRGRAVPVSGRFAGHQPGLLKSCGAGSAPRGSLWVSPLARRVRCAFAN